MVWLFSVGPVEQRHASVPVWPPAPTAAFRHNACKGRVGWFVPLWDSNRVRVVRFHASTATNQKPLGHYTNKVNMVERFSGHLYLTSGKEPVVPVVRGSANVSVTGKR